MCSHSLAICVEGKRAAVALLPISRISSSLILQPGIQSYFLWTHSIKRGFLPRKQKELILKFPSTMTTETGLHPDAEGTAFLQESNLKSLSDTFFSESLGFIHMLSYMSQTALAVWCTWNVLCSCIFYISERAAADLPSDNVQLAGSALRLTIVILHLSVHPSHCPSPTCVWWEMGLCISQQTSQKSVCCRCGFCLLSFPGPSVWGWNTPNSPCRTWWSYMDSTPSLHKLE